MVFHALGWSKCNPSARRLHLPSLLFTFTVAWGSNLVSIVPRASASRQAADPGFRGRGWSGWDDHPLRCTTSNVACTPSPKGRRSPYSSQARARVHRERLGPRWLSVFASPQLRNSRIRCSGLAISRRWRSKSATGKAYPARTSRSPQSRRPAIGDTRGLAPPADSDSASSRHSRSSASFSPPRVAPSSRPSGTRVRRSCTSVARGSLVQYSVSPSIARSNCPSARESSSSSAAITIVSGIRQRASRASSSRAST